MAEFGLVSVLSKMTPIFRRTEMFSSPSLPHLRLAQDVEGYQYSFILEEPKLLCSCKFCHLFFPFFSSLTGISNTGGWLVGFCLRPSHNKQ